MKKHLSNLCKGLLAVFMVSVLAGGGLWFLAQSIAAYDTIEKGSLRYRLLVSSCAKHLPLLEPSATFFYDGDSPAGTQSGITMHTALPPQQMIARYKEALGAVAIETHGMDRATLYAPHTQCRYRLHMRHDDNGGYDLRIYSWQETFSPASASRQSQPPHHHTAAPLSSVPKPKP